MMTLETSRQKLKSRAGGGGGATLPQVIGQTFLTNKTNPRGWQSL